MVCHCSEIALLLYWFTHMLYLSVPCHPELELPSYNPKLFTLPEAKSPLGASFRLVLLGRNSYLLQGVTLMKCERHTGS